MNPINTNQAHFTRSDRYSHINTQQVIDVLEQSGLNMIPGSTQVAKIRNQTRDGFQKHLIKFKPNFEVPEIPGCGFEVLLQNAHDGTSSFRLYVGIVRFACANGIIAGDFAKVIRIRHVGFTAGKVREGLKEIFATFETQKNVVDQMRNFNPSPMQIQHIASEIAQERILKRKDAMNYRLAGLGSILTPKREEDNANDLWTIFNRIQESVIRGGIKYKYETQEKYTNFMGDPKTRIKRHNRTTKEVTGIDQQQLLNRMVFNKCFSLLKTA